MMNEETPCEHKDILEYHFTSSENNREVIVKRCCEACGKKFPIEVEDSYHAGKIAVFEAEEAEGITP